MTSVGNGLKNESIQLVVFDLAGTTVEDKGEVPEAFAKVLQAHGIEVTGEALTAVRGASKGEVIQRIVRQKFPGDESEIIRRSRQIFQELRSHLATKYRDDGVGVVRGAPEAFSWLRSMGIKVAVNTGFDRTITRLILHSLAWDKGVIDVAVCSDDVPQGRPAPYLIFGAMEAAGVISVHCVATVGDTVLDLQAGWNAGVRWNIGVLSGAHGRDQLENAPHTHLLPSVANLPSLWE
jgi:phosphonatase-like hydrolase